MKVQEADPHAAEVARRLIALIAASRPGAAAEHVGSSAVPGLAGKGIIDLLLPTDPVDLTDATQALLGLGFQLQDLQAFPANRPMLWGVLRHRSTDYRLHVHVVPSTSPEVAAMRGFRDALCADPDLRHRYAALKRAIVADGPVDPMAFTRAKHDWIAAALGELGLPAGRRLYQDHPAETADALAAEGQPLPGWKLPPPAQRPEPAAPGGPALLPVAKPSTADTIHAGSKRTRPQGHRASQLPSAAAVAPLSHQEDPSRPLRSGHPNQAPTNASIASN